MNEWQWCARVFTTNNLFIQENERLNLIIHHTLYFGDSTLYRFILYIYSRTKSDIYCWGRYASECILYALPHFEILYGALNTRCDLIQWISWINERTANSLLNKHWMKMIIMIGILWRQMIHWADTWTANETRMQMAGMWEIEGMRQRRGWNGTKKRESQRTKPKKKKTCGIYDELNDSQNVSTIWTKRRNVNETTNSEWQNKRQAFGIIKNFPPQHTQHRVLIAYSFNSSKWNLVANFRIKLKVVSRLNHLNRFINCFIIIIIEVALSALSSRL